MDESAVAVRAVICDVYGTLLDVEHCRDRDTLEDNWRGLFQEVLDARPPISFVRFQERARTRIDEDHVRLRSIGVSVPEIDWPDIACDVLPMLRDVPDSVRSDWFAGCAGVDRKLTLARGAARVLRMLHDRGVLLGIASNAQAYTVRELSTALAAEALDMSLFDPGVRFWSYEYGFSKPDAHVFRILGTRLRARGVAASQTWMVGDRIDNDIEPALRHGWKAWRISSEPRCGWEDFAEQLS